jgi:hypothetical protein
MRTEEDAAVDSRPPMKLDIRVIAPAALAYALLQQLWMYGTFSAPLERSVRVEIVRSAELGTFLVFLIAAVLFSARALPHSRLRAAGSGAFAAASGFLLSLIASPFTLPELIFREGISIASIMGYALSMTVFGLAAGAGTFIVDALLRILLDQWRTAVARRRYH